MLLQEGGDDGGDLIEFRGLIDKIVCAPFEADIAVIVVGLVGQHDDGVCGEAGLDIP
jgi:hypothetical protein